MLELVLSNNPNQSFTVQLEMHQYDIAVKSINPNNVPGVGVMAVSISRDNVPIVRNLRAAPLVPLIPYAYLENGEGNFFFFTLNNDYPDYMQFGITQSLLYLTNTELEALRDQ